MAAGQKRRAVNDTADRNSTGKKVGLSKWYPFFVVVFFWS